ncbi:MAG: CopD family protein [Chloroflexota bacterium]|nr:CopD family protein [Chloroflexota bacterium]MDE2968644.1 CopD family protein [Chloroflexota bacterium]
MEVTDVVLVIAQWLHTLAAAFWVGGGLVYLLVIRPAARGEALRQAQGERTGQTLADEFRGLVDIAVIAMVVTGVVLAFDRLTSQHAGAGYAAVLGVKLALTLWMFWLAGVIRRRRPRPASQPAPPPPPRTGWRQLMDSANQVVAIGVVVFLLSTLMQALFERALQ